MPSYDAHPFSEKLTTLKRIFARYGLNGVVTVMKNEQVFYRTVLQGVGVCTIQEERKIRFGNLRSSLWKINHRRFHLVICVLEYHHLSPSSANISTVSHVRHLNLYGRAECSAWKRVKHSQKTLGRNGPLSTTIKYSG